MATIYNLRVPFTELSQAAQQELIIDRRASRRKKKATGKILKKAAQKADKAFDKLSLNQVQDLLEQLTKD